MDIQSFVDKMADQYDETDHTRFTPETKFKELDEWSSLIALTVIAMVDEAYRVRLKGDDIRNSQTIEDLFLIVKGRV